MKKKNFKKSIFGIILITLNGFWLFALPWIPLSANKSIEVKYLDIPAPFSHAFIFFGFPGCSLNCPITMKQLQVFYDSISPEQQAKTSIIFINLRTELPPHFTEEYVRAYHVDFRGLHPSEDVLSSLQKEFGFQFSRTSPLSADIKHQGFLYFLRNHQSQWVIEHILNVNSLRPSSLINLIAEQNTSI